MSWFNKKTRTPLSELDEFVQICSAAYEQEKQKRQNTPPRMTEAQANSLMQPFVGSKAFRFRDGSYLRGTVENIVWDTATFTPKWYICSGPTVIFHDDVVAVEKLLED